MGVKIQATGWFIWGLILFIVAIVILTGLSYLGVFTGTVVERKVFENSFQYSEANKERVATFEAQLVEIESQLMRGDLEEGTRKNLEASASAIRVQLATARAK